MSREKLKEIFDACTWGDKNYGSLPECADEVLYLWREDEATVASYFFSTKGGSVLTEDHPAVKRSLYLGQLKDGGWALCVRQVEKKDFSAEKVAGGLTSLMDPGRISAYLNRKTGDS